jgi:hypothetical protein
MMMTTPTLLQQIQALQYSMKQIDERLTNLENGKKDGKQLLYLKDIRNHLKECLENKDEYNNSLFYNMFQESSPSLHGIW